ncbi:LacI family DNA-binding transcriptional regulator [Plantibacter sp. YIM 135249]|uniref:LacI family DNA-binding transcriptional regulator n=1 Tax=Plantibacter sp. YIM 135249 TaxID=3423918 RepID=UPI003D32BB19
MNDEAARDRAPNIRDVARLAGVSHQTVSRVLNDPAAVREATKTRVQAVMDQLNYRPNRAARALVTSRSRTIGVLASQRSQYGPASTIQAIENACSESGYMVSTVNLADTDDASILAALDHLLARGVDALVIIAPQVRVFGAIQRLDVRVPFVTVQASEDDENAIGVDQTLGARLATRHLIELGHRHIYHLAGPQDWIEAESRMRGFLAEMGDQDVPTTAPILGDWSADFGYRAGRELISIRDFTAIFSSNDQMALGLIHAIREAGYDVPRDVSIIGFDDIPEAAHFWPPLTTVRQDFAELGRQCVARLIGQLENDAVGWSGRIAPELIVRKSTAPPSF